MRQGVSGRVSPPLRICSAPSPSPGFISLSSVRISRLYLDGNWSLGDDVYVWMPVYSRDRVSGVS